MTRLRTFVLFTATSWMLVGEALGQFASTINVPPDPAPGIIDSSTRLNLTDGGELLPLFQAGLSDGTSTDVEVNIDGGFVGSGFRANGGSVVNIRGGTFGTGFDSALRANSGSEVNVSGGRVGAIAALDGSELTLSGGTLVAPLSTTSGNTFRIVGGDFRLNGELVAGLQTVGNSVLLPPISLSFLSGTLSDGTPFGLGNLKFDVIGTASLTLEAAELPEIDSNLISIPADAAPAGIRAGQTLIVTNGGTVESSFVAGWGSTVEVAGGSIGGAFKAIGATVMMTSGSLGTSSRLIQGSTMSVSGGTVDDFLTVHEGSSLQVSGGRIGTALEIKQGGSLEISGGAGFHSLFLSGSMKLIGGDFRINGQPLTNPELENVGGTVSVSVPIGSLLTGVFADGTPFATSNSSPTLQSATLPPIGSAAIDASTDLVPLGIREGQTLTVSDGAIVGDYFSAGRGSRVVIAGGDVGKELDAVDAEIDLSGGSLGGLVHLYQGTVFTMSGGTVAALPPNYINATILSISDDSQTRISGGLVDGRVRVEGSLSLAGGTIAGPVRATSGSDIHVFGKQFMLDGVDVTSSLEQNVAFTITQRGVSLTGILADGTPFGFVLNPSSGVSSADVFDPLATLSVTLVLPGDYNADGVVGVADYTIWRNALGSQVTAGTGADGNFDSIVSNADYSIWKNNFGTLLGAAGDSVDSAMSVPEVSSLLMSLTLLYVLSLIRLRPSVAQE